MGMGSKDKVKEWYDGFVFGSVSDIYNPWSIINLLDTGKFGTYWANTSGNSLVGKLIREGNREIPERFYHGFVLGLMVDLRERYVITSNRESGKNEQSSFGRLVME